MSASLLVKPASAGDRWHDISPERAGWRHVGFEALALAAGATLERERADREQCLVLLAGRARISAAGQDLGSVGARRSPFEGKPHAVYVPPRTALVMTAETACDVAIGSAPAAGSLPPRLIRPDEVGTETRGTGTNTRYIYNVLPASAAAESLLLVEVLTPGGHWSSYPPHKHDCDRHGETQLEEIYYHRLARPGGFALQRVYTDDRSLDETMAVEDRDVVLVPRGYHPVSAAHGFDLYYLNVMAGPVRNWQFTTAPGYEFLTRRP